jgi:hypothetical protein
VNGGKPLHPNVGKHAQLASQVAARFGIPRNDCLRLTDDSMVAALAAGDPSLLLKKDGTPYLTPVVQTPPPPPVAPPPVKLTKLQALRAFYEALAEEVATAGYPKGVDPNTFNSAADKFDKALSLAERPNTPGEGVAALKAAVKLAANLIA